MAAEPDDLDRELASYIGLGMTIAEACALAGCSDGTYYARSNKRPEFYDSWRLKYEAAAAITVTKKLAELERNASQKQRIAEKAYRKLEQLLDREALDALALKSTREGLDRAEGRSVDRKYIESKHKETKEITVTVLDDTVDAIRAFQQHIRRPELPPSQAVIDA